MKTTYDFLIGFIEAFKEGCLIDSHKKKINEILMFIKDNFSKDMVKKKWFSEEEIRVVIDKYICIAEDSKINAESLIYNIKEELFGE